MRGREGGVDVTGSRRLDPQKIARCTMEETADQMPGPDEAVVLL
jgi:hypothetical protein